MLELEAEGMMVEVGRCSTEDRVPALLENLGSAALEILSLREGRSSLEARSTKSGLGSPKNRLGRDAMSKET